MSPVAAPVKAGDILADKYCVERILGIGGMGVVVAAEHVALHQKVALKFMLPEALADEGSVERFMREARAAVRLRSEHVARVMDVGCMENGAPYIVMEFLEGEDMEHVIRKEAPMREPVAVDMILQACMAMAEAHSVGIVHRDLKPANLFVTQRPDGSRQVKVLDFGISKIQESDDQVSQTKSSMAMGSPGYMAPEQMRSAKHADHRADIWALGTILYKMLSTKLPFYAESAPEMFAAVLTGESIPLPSVVPGVNPELAEVIHRCLERDRELRYHSVAELAKALAPFGNERAAQMAASIASVGVAAAIATEPAVAVDPDLTAPLRKSPPASSASGPPMTPTQVSESQPPQPSPDFAANPLTTRRASAGQAVVAAPSTDARPEPSQRGHLGRILGAVGVAAIAVVATLLFAGDDKKPAPAAATDLPSDAAAKPADAGVADATQPVPAAIVPTDAAVVAGPPDAAPKRQHRPRPTKPAREETPTPSVNPKPTPKPKPAVEPKPKPKPDDDPFGTMQ